ncbi:MAG: S1 RNA-binding domain-containing protein, partial [Thermotogota bacterium]|nr:S1 RNA-binding domain-containing protein [Thermotogota bacterium]
EEIRLRPDDFLGKVRAIGLEVLSAELQVTEGELTDALDALTIKHVDPRDSFPQPLLKKEVRDLDDLREGMELEGTVRNVVDFGAFVDIGVKIDGLVHQSQFGKRWAKPSEIVRAGEIIRVRILKVDKERERINLAFVQKA